MPIIVPDPPSGGPVGGMTVAQIKAAVKRYGFDDNDPILTWINAAYHEFEDAEDWQFLIVVADPLAGATGESRLTLPANYLKTMILRDVTNQKKLKYWDVHKFSREIDDPTATGKPLYYTANGAGELQFYPVLDAGVDFRLLYLRTWSDLDDDADIPLLPVRFHYALVLGAVKYALMAESEEDRSKTAADLFGSAIARAQATYATTHVDEDEQVEDTQLYS